MSGSLAGSTPPAPAFLRPAGAPADITPPGAASHPCPPCRSPAVRPRCPVMRSNAVSDWSGSGLDPVHDGGGSTAALDGARTEQPGARIVRVEQIVARHVDAIWRTARELGVLPRDLDDVVQEVL